MTVQEIIDVDERVDDLTNGLFDSIPPSISKSPYPQTGKLLIDITRRINELKEGIFDVCYSDNYYCSKILLRVIIEHFLLGMYAVDRFSKVKDDSVGTEYYKNWKRQEEIQYWEATSKIGKLINREDLVN
jgi:hypothetical protein